MHTYKRVEIPHVSPPNTNSWNVEHLRWFEFRPVRHFLVVKEDPQRSSGHERIHDIPNNVPNDQRVPGHIYHRHEWEERDTTRA